MENSSNSVAPLNTRYNYTLCILRPGSSYILQPLSRAVYIYAWIYTCVVCTVRVLRSVTFGCMVKFGKRTCNSVILGLCIAKRCAHEFGINASLTLLCVLYFVSCGFDNWVFELLTTHLLVSLGHVCQILCHRLNRASRLSDC